MKITIESTTKTVFANNVECRVWEGKTSTGVEVECLIVRIAASKTEDLSQFEAELKEQRPPSVQTAFPLRLVL